MNGTIKDQISALVDDELSHAECELLVRRLHRDPELRRTAGRYVLMGEVMRGASVIGAPGELSRRVMAAVEAESAHRAGGGMRLLRRAVRPALGFAVAASVAVVAVLSLRVVPPEVDSPAAGPATVYATPLPATEVRAVTPPAQLTRYMLQHSEYTTTLGRQAMLPSIVAYDARPLTEDEQEQGESAENGD